MEDDEAAANGWSEHGQLSRFMQALYHAEVRQGEKVLDWGCGTGRLSDFVPTGAWYQGLDASEAMVERAIASRPEVPIDHEMEVPADEFDVTFALGVWNVKPWDPAWTRHEIEKLWTITKRVLVVSLLRSGCDRSVTYDPVHLATWASTLSWNWIVDCAYLDNDVMLVVERGA